MPDRRAALDHRWACAIGVDRGRLARANAIVLVDTPLWMHFWLAAERQIAWAQGFRTIFEVDATGCRKCVA
jgi:hypothetical protein